MIISYITRRQLSKMYDANTLPPLPKNCGDLGFSAAINSWQNRHSKNGIAHYTDAQYSRALKKIVVDYYCDVLNINR